MPLNTVELLNAAELVAERYEMKVCLKYSFLGAGITSLTTLIGGILGGPAGMVVGATGGGLASYKISQGKFKSVVNIIREDFTETQRSQLAEHISLALKDLDITDAVQLLALVSSKEAVAATVLMTVKKYIEGEMRLPVSY